MWWGFQLSHKTVLWNLEPVKFGKRGLYSNKATARMWKCTEHATDAYTEVHSIALLCLFRA